MEIPKLTVNVYPEKGADRIVEISFQYERDLILLLQMRGKVEEYFRAAEESVRGMNDVAQIYEQFYLYLTAHYQQSNFASTTPAYSIFVEGKGNDKALADVYTRLCTRSGLGCKTVSGTRNGQRGSWNAIQLRGRYYEVDLLKCLENQAFLLLTDEQLVAYRVD